jgi:hypothetical protein
MAKAAPITSRFFGIEQAARRLGNQETEYCLVEGTLPAWQRKDFLKFEELDRFREGLLQRGVHRDHLDAVRAAVQGAPIPGRCWRRWFAMGIVNLETGTVALQFPGYRHAVVFQPQVQSTDVLQRQVRAAKKSPVVENRPVPSNPSPQGVDPFNTGADGRPTAIDPSSDSGVKASREPSFEQAARDAAIQHRLINGVRPGSTVQWERFCDRVRADCGVYFKNPIKRGLSDDRITRVTRVMMKRQA